MVTEFLAYAGGASVAEVVEDLRVHAAEYRDYVVQYLYVVDHDERLEGVLRMRDLLLAPRETPVRELALTAPVRVRDDATLDELRDFFARHHWFGVPVVDADGRLLGLVRRSDVEQALEERLSADYLKSQGIAGGEELRSMPLGLRSRRRLGWLSVNIVLNVLAASVIAFYQDTLDAVITLAVFLPIISDMSGCSGNQAVAVSLRELSLGLVRPRDAARVWFDEVSVGLINGAALGVLLALVALAWQGNAWLGAVVGAALAANTVLAVSIGGTLPLIIRRLGKDPALASGPILTTITDTCGFLLVLGLATRLLPQLG
jgi:magnesium transporter